MIGRMYSKVRALRGSGRVGFAIVAFWLLVAVFGPIIAPYSIGEFVDRTVFAGASSAYWLGTDFLGRDVLSRLM